MRLILSALLFCAGAPALAADLAKVDRSIAKEPKYAGQPRYCLLVFGAGAKHRVWLVQDGDKLYVDRNGNGDLTDPGECVRAKNARPGDSEGVFSFEVGELTVGGKTHKGLAVSTYPVKKLADNTSVMAVPHVARDVKKYPNDITAGLELDVECTSLKGGGLGGRVSYMMSLFDAQGVLRFASKPAEAPIIHLDGPLQITFYVSTPTWTGGRSDDAVLCIGTPGLGPGTFAMVKYEGTVPEGKHPKVEATYRPKDPAMKPVKELHELKERC
jgi:hypothetical protein